MSTSIGAQTDVDHTGLALAVGIINDIADAVGDTHIGNLALGHTTSDNVGIGSHAIPAISTITASSDTCSLGAVGGLSLIGSQRSNLLGSLIATTRHPAIPDHGLHTAIVKGHVHSLDACVPVRVTQVNVIEVKTAVNHAHNNALAGVWHIQASTELDVLYA